MGSGKSVIGAALAKALNYKYIDLDAYLEEQEDRSIAQLFKEKGELYFRKKEAATVSHLLQKKGNQVIALGGGTPCYGTVMEDILNTPNARTIYLKASVNTLTDRLFPEREHRPLIAHLETQEVLEEFIRKHLFERNFYYLKSHHIISVANETPEEIATKIERNAKVKVGGSYSKKTDIS